MSDSSDLSDFSYLEKCRLMYYPNSFHPYEDRLQFLTTSKDLASTEIELPEEFGDLYTLCKRNDEVLKIFAGLKDLNPKGLRLTVCLREDGTEDTRVNLETFDELRYVADIASRRDADLPQIFTFSGYSKSKKEVKSVSVPRMAKSTASSASTSAASFMAESSAAGISEAYPTPACPTPRPAAITIPPDSAKACNIVFHKSHDARYFT